MSWITYDHLYIYIKTEIIYHAWKSLLFDGNDRWMKKQSGLFDVAMGAYDGQEVCELVGTYMLSLISEKYNEKDFGPYCDDRLGVVKNKSGSEREKIKKNIQKIFKENKLDIVIKCNMKLVNYLDVTLDLNNSNYISLTTNQIMKYYISLKIKTTHSASLIKSPNQLRNPYHLTKPYLTNQKKFIKKF